MRPILAPVLVVALARAASLEGLLESETTLDARDFARAAQPRPEPTSYVHGATAADAYAAMNGFLRREEVRTAACDVFDHAELNLMVEMLYLLRSPELDTAYANREDRRALHFASIAYKQTLWAAEAVASTLMPSYAAGGVAYAAARDGKCAEAVLLYVHHLSADRRAALAELDVTLPLMPTELAPASARSAEYDQQIGCTSCHVAVAIPGAGPITPIPFKNSTAPQYPETCPIDAETGLPSVFYDRTKRCDWDYAPFCAPCEGVGGMIWGPGEHDWLPMPCEVLATPSEIDPANLTSPVWPRSFSVDEYATLTFPGRDPCAIDFKNSTYTLYFETDENDLPTYHSVGHTGPSGPSPVPGKSWALPNGNFFNTVDLFGHTAFCLCISTIDPVVDNAITGPLVYDFNHDAKLIGREKVRPEYFDYDIVADHWVKGPHHFWIEVETNTMVREWQPFNGLQTYHNWNLTAPDPQDIELPKMCYQGLLHVNISCIAPPPDAHDA